MKPLQIILAVIFSLLLGISNLVAQSSVEKLNLTKEQKQLLKSQKELIKKNREEFKATLSPSQLAILKNQALTKLERQQALKKSLTLPQKKLVAQNNNSVKLVKSKFRGTLTKSQKSELRKRFKNKDSKKRLKKNIRKRIQNNRRR